MRSALFYAGIAGGLLAHLGRSVNYEQFGFDMSIQFLAMIVIGGLASVRCALVGAAFVTLLPTRVTRRDRAT